VTAAVLTPFTSGEAVELGNRLWRKKVLPVGDVEYKGRLLHFTKDYLGQLAQAFRDRAYDQVAFQLADAQNTHTNDPERFRGDIVGMDAEPDGLWLTLQPTEAGNKVLTENPNLGVSARIVEDYARSDGRRFPAAIQHVLGTLDPRIPGLGAWTAIEAATPVPEQVVDLSALHFAGEAPAIQITQPPEGTDGMPDLTSLSDADKQRLTKLLDLPDDVLDALAAGGTVVTPEELEALTDPGDTGDEGDDGDGGQGEDAAADELADEIAAMSDGELAALEAEWAAAESGTPDATPDYVPEGEPVTAGLTAEAQFAIDLANARQEETARELAVVTARLREEDYQAEKRHLADLGVPPYITELARPLLEGAGRAVELANGKTVDAGAITRKVLTEYARQARLLDLSDEMGSPHDEPDDAGDGGQAATSRDDLVSRFKTVTGLK
jgi:hypothetical protein